MCWDLRKEGRVGKLICDYMELLQEAFISVRVMGLGI